jgi:hypothetical protein
MDEVRNPINSESIHMSDGCALASEAQAPVTPYEIGGVWSGTEAGFPLILFSFPLLIIIPEVTRTHLLPSLQVHTSPEQAVQSTSSVFEFRAYLWPYIWFVTE